MMWNLAACTFHEPVDVATAGRTIVPFGGPCAGMALTVHFKNGTTRERFAVCAVTDTYVEPCCKDKDTGSPIVPCAKPERLKFVDMASIESGPQSPLLRCAMRNY